MQLNGDFHRSPLITSVQRLHELFSLHSVPYAVIGGMAVVRHGAVRTTIDVDVLTTREGWKLVRQSAPAEFALEVDSGVDRTTGVDLDILFSGNEWDMCIPLYDPVEVREFDNLLGAWFIDFPHLLELKTAVFMKKRDEDGIEIAAKDLADIVALIENNPEKIDETFLKNLNESIRKELEIIIGNINR